MMTQTIDELMKTYLPDDYNDFLAGDFLNSKTLKIENVRNGKIDGNKCLKIDVRIIEDKGGSNEGKVFTVRIDGSDEIEDEMLNMYHDDLLNHLGYPLILDASSDVEQAYFYQQNMLTLIVKDYEIDKKAKKIDVQSTSMKNRPLKDLANYRLFDIEGFFEENEIYLSGSYFEKGDIIFYAKIDDEAIVKFAVPIEKFDSLPASFLSLNGLFDDLVSDYTFNKVSSHRYGTRWTFHFEDITFKSGVVTDDVYKLSYDEPVRKKEKPEQQTSVTQKEETTNTFKDSQRPFGTQRRI